MNEVNASVHSHSSDSQRGRQVQGFYPRARSNQYLT
jgi:hypothetical protein